MSKLGADVGEEHKVDIVLKKVLVPTDFSENSKAAIRYGCALCEAFDAEMHLLHVMEDPMIYPPMAEGYAPAMDFAELEREVEQQLQQAVSAEWQQKIKIERVTRRGAPFLEVIRYAKEAPVDLIVMGTHGRGAIAHMLLGSVAEKVVRKAPCPVLTIRQPEHEFVLP
jgi:nucleotide-binding universal stress UspA family protein